MASKRLGEYIIFPFHRNQGHNKAEAREARLETLVNRILFKTGAAYGLAESSHTASAHSFSAFSFKLRNKFTSVAKKSLELVSCVRVHALGAQGRHSYVEVRGQPRDLFAHPPCFGSDEISHCPGTSQFSRAGWPGRDPLISVFPGMGLKRWPVPCL